MLLVPQPIDNGKSESKSSRDKVGEVDVPELDEFITDEPSEYLGETKFNPRSFFYS